MKSPDVKSGLGCVFAALRRLRVLASFADLCVFARNNDYKTRFAPRRKDPQRRKSGRDGPGAARKNSTCRVGTDPRTSPLAFCASRFTTCRHLSYSSDSGATL